MARVPAQPLRVAVVLDTVPPWSKGGRERRSAELLPRLANRDIAICVYTMRWWDEPPSGPIRYQAICPRIRLYRNGRRSTVQAVLFALGTLQLLLRRFDVIMADHMPYLQLFPLRLIAWIRRVPLVCDWHESWDALYWREYLGRFGGLGAWIERTAEKLPDVIVPVSPALGRTLAAHGVTQSRLAVISNAVDRDVMNRTVPAADAPQVLFVGRLVQHKRADLAIEAFSKLRPRAIALRMGIIGIGPERERLEELARQLGVAQLVRFFGSVEDDTSTWALVRGADVLVATSEREGFGMTVAESLALGTPVVTVARAGNAAQHLVESGSTGSVVPVGDAGAVAAAIDMWLDRSAERFGVSARFWEMHPELDWNVSADRYAGLLRKLTAARGAG